MMPLSTLEADMINDGRDEKVVKPMQTPHLLSRARRSVNSKVSAKVNFNEMKERRIIIN